MKKNITDIQFFRNPKEPRGYSNCILICLIAFGMLILGSTLGSIPLFFPMPNIIKTSVFELSAAFGLSSLFIFLYVRKREKQPLTSLGFTKDNSFKKYLYGFGIGILLMSLVVLVGSLLGAFEVSFALGGKDLISGLFPILLMMVGFIIQGGSEEVLTRGFIFTRVASRYNIPLGIALSVIVFTALHALNPGMTLLPIINLALFALFAALYMIHSKNIWGICGFHSSWNWFQGNIYGIKVSGTTMVGGSIFQTESIEGKELLSGGQFGAEGSIICTLVFVMCIIYLSYKIMKKYTLNHQPEATPEH